MSTATATDRLLGALSDPDAVFNSTQVAYLMGVSARWARESTDEEPSELSYRAGYSDGYRKRVAEENADYATRYPITVDAKGNKRSGTRREDMFFTGGRWHQQALNRQNADAVARDTRPGDYTGNPGELWPRWASWCEQLGEHPGDLDTFIYEVGAVITKTGQFTDGRYPASESGERFGGYNDRYVMGVR